MKEIKLELDRNRHSTEKFMHNMDGSMVDITRGLVKTEQYNRRDTITVTGLPKASGETPDTLKRKV